MASDTPKTIGPTALAAAAATIYTVPAATTATIVHLHVINNHNVAVNLTVSLGADAAGTRIWDQIPIQPQSAGDFLDDTGPYELAAGAVLQAFGSVASKLVLTGVVVETA